MRKALAIGAVLISSIVPGCSGGNAAPPKPPEASPQPDQGVARSAPVKQLAINDQCSVVTPDQRNALGLAKPPRSRTSEGKPGCQYEAGEIGQPGWGAFVAIDSGRTEKQFKQAAHAVSADFPGYPAAQVNNGSGCLFAVDISDNGSLFVNVLVREGAKPDACQQAKQVALSAVQNLPNA